MSEKLSIVIPVYNEEATISQVLNKVLETKFECAREIIVVNDFSSDRTEEILSKVAKRNGDIRIHSLKKNSGKGAAVRHGIAMAKGTIVAIQDADLEYNVEDLSGLVSRVIRREAEVVYGSRFLNGGKKGELKYYLGNRFLSLFTSILFFRKITDMETCYKVFRREVISGLRLRANRFEIEPEITAKILRKGFEIQEFPISYSPRDRKSGKKIKIFDGLSAMFTLLRYRFMN